MGIPTLRSKKSQQVFRLVGIQVRQAADGGIEALFALEEGDIEKAKTIIKNNHRRMKDLEAAVNLLAEGGYAEYLLKHQTIGRRYAALKRRNEIKGANNG